LSMKLKLSFPSAQFYLFGRDIIFEGLIPIQVCSTLQ
jgi:hypothetical protein